MAPLAVDPLAYLNSHQSKGHCLFCSFGGSGRFFGAESKALSPGMCGGLRVLGSINRHMMREIGVEVSVYAAKIG